MRRIHDLTTSPDGTPNEIWEAGVALSLAQSRLIHC